MNNKTIEQLEKLNGDVNQIYNTYRSKSLQCINTSKQEYAKAKEIYNENMQKTMIGELTIKTEDELEKYKSKYLVETENLLNAHEKLREAELVKVSLTKEDKILDELIKINLQKEFEIKYGIMDVDKIQQNLSNIDNELEFNTAKYMAYNKLDDKSIINRYQYKDKILYRIDEIRNSLKLSEAQHKVYLVDGQVEYLITGKDPSDYFFS